MQEYTSRERADAVERRKKELRRFRLLKGLHNALGSSPETTETRTLVDNCIIPLKLPKIRKHQRVYLEILSDAGNTACLQRKEPAEYRGGSSSSEPVGSRSYSSAKIKWKAGKGLES